MKPASIIFLVLGVLVVIAGIITCSYAEALAEEEGIDIFNETVDQEGNRVSYLDYDTSELNKIAISVKSGDVTIVGSDTQRVEMQNYLEGTYFKGAANNTLYVNDTMSIVDMFKEGGLGLSFNGLRTYIRSFMRSGGDKAVTVYIPSGISLNAISVYIEDSANSTVTVKGLDTTADLQIEANSGNIVLDNVFSSGIVVIKGDSGSTEIKGGSLNELRYESKDGDISFSDVWFSVARIEVSGKGNIYLKLANAIDGYEATISAGGGIFADGKELGGTFKTETASMFSITASTEEGRVEIGQ